MSSAAPARAFVSRADPEVEEAKRGRERSKLPRLLVSGSDGDRVEEIARTLEGLNASIECLSWEECLEALRGSVAGVVLVLPIRRVAMRAAVQIIRDHPQCKTLPLYPVVPDGTSSRHVRRLYSMGATAVLEWPREASIFRDLFAESFGISRVRGRSKKADISLSRSVRAHLRIFSELDAGRLRVFSRDGLITVSGQVRTLAQRSDIIDAITAVPGVRSVLAQSLRVAPSNIPDKTLKKRIAESLKDSEDLDDATISIQVRNGHVKLTGTVGERADVRRLERLVVNLSGTRGLVRDLTVSPDQQSADSQITRRYRKALENLYPRESVSLSVVAGVAVIAGGVRSLSVKQSIERLLSRDVGIERVVNKIRVE